MLPKLRDKKIRIAFREETARQIEDQDTSRGKGWDEIWTILIEAAKLVCEQPKRVANPWTIGHVRELEALDTDISNWVKARNRAIEDKSRTSPEIMKRKLTKARHSLKKNTEKTGKRLVAIYHQRVSRDGSQRGFRLYAWGVEGIRWQVERTF